MKYILILSLLICQNTKAQLMTGKIENGLSFVRGLSWEENQKQDSVTVIHIEGDTITAVKNLLIYCLQEKRENDYARILLSMLNLDNIKTMFKENDFSFYLKEYRKAVAENKKYRSIYFPEYFKPVQYFKK